MANSLHTYPGTDVLINHANIRDPDELNRYESLVATHRNAELKLQPIIGKFNFDHLKKIHKYLFGDVYPFAGKVRNENIAKDNFRFARCEFIEVEAMSLFSQLKKENHLQGLDVDRFSERAAHYMAEINVLHPFREGNGRAQREFTRTLALNSGYELDWSRVNKDDIFKASVRSHVNTSDLAKVIRGTIINEQPIHELSKLFRDLSKSRSTGR